MMTTELKQWFVKKDTVDSMQGNALTAIVQQDGRDDCSRQDNRSFTRGTPKLAALVPAIALLFGGLGSGKASAAPVPLVLPQSTAFSILGHSCGGIQEQSYALGFDAMTGYPTGDVYMQTRCGGSGKGGGYKTTTYSAWAFVTWDFAGNVISWSRITGPSYTAGFSQVDVFGDALYDSGTLAYLAVPAPLAPTDVTVVQSGDQLEISWTPEGVNPLAISSSVLTATPVGSSASTLTATVTGSASSGLIGGIQPLTTYQVTVANSSIGGSGPPSASVSITTAAASVAPSAPTGVSARWTAVGAATATLVATWLAATPGDSPIDQYEVTINGSDGGGTFTQDVPGTSLTASFAGIDFIPDWSVAVRAHNAVGWGPWSAGVTLGGL